MPWKLQSGLKLKEKALSVSHYMARRYLVSNRENRYFSWITLLSICGIAIGVAALIVVISVFNGFEYELRQRFLLANAHIMAFRYPAGMEAPERWSAKIHKDFKGVVKGISPFVHNETMAKKGAIMHGVLVRGVEPIERAKVQDISQIITPRSALDAIQKEHDDSAKGLGVPEVPSVILGSGVLGLLDVKIGDTLQILAPSAARETRMQTFKIIGTYNSGLKHYDNRLVIMSIPAAQRLFKMNTIVTGLEISLYNEDDSVKVAQDMESKYNLSFREWQSFNKPLFEALKKERVLITLIVALVVIVAAFNIFTTTFVAVTQKQRDISIVRALGAKRRQIIAIFINQSLYMGIIGSTLGVALAFGISQLLERYQFIDLPDPYFLKNLPVHYSFKVYGLVYGTAILVCIVAGLFPSTHAAKVNPTDGFKGLGGVH